MICATPVSRCGMGLLIMFDRCTSTSATDRLSSCHFFFVVGINGCEQPTGEVKSST